MAEEIEWDPNGVPYVRTYGFPERGGWVKTPRDLLRDATLDSAAKIIYMLLVDECQRTNSSVIQYSYARIRNETGLNSHHTIRRKLAMLEARDLLEVEGDEGRSSAHTYRYYKPTPPDEAMYVRIVTRSYAHKASRSSRNRAAINAAPPVDLPTPPMAENAEHGGHESRPASAELPSKEEDPSDILNTSQTAGTAGTSKVQADDAHPVDHPGGTDQRTTEEAPALQVPDEDALRDFLGDEFYEIHRSLENP